MVARVGSVVRVVRWLLVGAVDVRVVLARLTASKRYSTLIAIEVAVCRRQRRAVRRWVRCQALRKRMRRLISEGGKRVLVGVDGHVCNE